MVLRSPVKEQTVVNFRDFLICLFLTEDTSQVNVRFGFILCFFGLLRISNVTIQRENTVDISRNLLIGDIEDQGDALKIFLKWSKSSQFTSEIIILPKARTPILCPVRTWREYRKNYLPNDVDISMKVLLNVNGDKVEMITSDHLRLLFNKVFQRGGLNSKYYSPHSLRRGGATFLADNSLPFQSIKRHGLWKTDAIENYLRSMSKRNTPVFHFLKDL